MDDLKLIIQVQHEVMRYPCKDMWNDVAFPEELVTGLCTCVEATKEMGKAHRLIAVLRESAAPEEEGKP